jgi:hypothetical protein
MDRTPLFPRGVDSIVPALHRRAAEGAVLRDSRLEIAIDDHGAVTTRLVPGCNLVSRISPRAPHPPGGQRR